MEMEEERIGMVLVRVSELRSKIANCIDNSNSTITANGDEDGDAAAPMDDEQADSLLNICYAFDSLESQLSSLQALRQQQQYEREAVIGDIEYSRKLLLKQLADYKGQHHLDVIHEAETFASMKVEHDTELILPPYPSHSPHSLLLDATTNQSRASFSRKLPLNGFDAPNDPKQIQTKSNKLWGGIRFLVHSTAKTMLTLVGVISLLSLAGFETKLNKKGTNFNVLTLFQQPHPKDGGLVAHCPPGKVAVLRDGELRCIVKERVEIPFDSAADNADVNFGCG